MHSTLRSKRKPTEAGLLAAQRRESKLQLSPGYCCGHCYRSTTLPLPAAAGGQRQRLHREHRSSKLGQAVPGSGCLHKEYIQLQQRLEDAAREEAREEAERDRQEQRRRSRAAAAQPRRSWARRDASGDVRRRQHREGCGWTWQGETCSSFCTYLTVALPVAAHLPVSCIGNGLRGDRVNADGRHVLPAMEVECPYCGALHLPQEKVGCQAAVVACVALLCAYGN